MYLALAGLDESGERATFKVFINPLQVWLWSGVLIMLGGTIFLLLPERERRAVLRAEGATAESVVRRA